MRLKTSHYRPVLALELGISGIATLAWADDPGLWKVYGDTFNSAKHVNLTQRMTPCIPVLIGFCGPNFVRASARAHIERYAAVGESFTLDENGFEAASSILRTGLSRHRRTARDLYPKFGSGLAGYVRNDAIRSPNWPHGVSVGELSETPLPKLDKPLQFSRSLRDARV